MHDVAVVVFSGALVLVGLDRSDVARCTLHESVDEVVGGSFDLVTSSGWAALVILVDVVGEESVDEGVGALASKVEQILQKLILVFVSHAVDRVVHITGVVLDHELTLPGCKVRVAQTVQSLRESTVGCAGIGVCCGTGVVESSKNSWRSLLLD
jgi:hypothetical protein